MQFLCPEEEAPSQLAQCWKKETPALKGPQGAHCSGYNRALVMGVPVETVSLWGPRPTCECGPPDGHLQPACGLKGLWGEGSCRIL